MSSLRNLRWLIAILCIAVVVLRVGGPHLHLCFDGSEPPVTLHVTDFGDHHAGSHHADDSHAETLLADFAHEDQDVGVGSDLVSKKLSGDADVAVLALLCALLLFLIPRQLGTTFAWLIPVAGPDRSHLRPPLRGPPLPG